MANIKSTLAATGQKVAPRVAGEAIRIYSEYALTAAPLLNDTFQMIPIPTNARVLYATLGADKLDSNATPLVTLALGDTSNNARYVPANTVAQNGTAPVNTLLKTGFGFLYTTDDFLTVTVTAAPATFQAGTIRVEITYVI